MEARIKVIFIFFLGNIILSQGYIFDEVGISNSLSLSDVSQESNVEAELLQEALEKIALFKESFECPPAFTYKECFEIALKIVSRIIDDTLDKVNPPQDETKEFRKPKSPITLSHADPESKVIQEVQDKLATFKESFDCPPAFTYKECFEFALNVTSNIIDDAIEERSVNEPPLEDTVKLEKHKNPTFPWWPSFDHDPSEDQLQLVEADDYSDTDKEFIMQMGVSEDEGIPVLRNDYDKPFYCRCRDGNQGHGHFNCRCRPIIDQPLKFTQISTG